jgi:hypothetical protein
MPSGREYHTPKSFVPPTLDEESIVRMRAPPDPAESAFKGEEEDSDDEDARGPLDAPGAFPASQSSMSTIYY